MAPAEGRAGDERRLAVALAIAEGERTGVAEGLPVLGAGVGVGGAGDGVGPTGVTAVEAADGVLAPPPFFATTVNV